MNAITIVMLAIWNVVLVGGFVLVLVFRKNVMHWLAEDDEQSVRESDADWLAFLGDHPELQGLQAEAASNASPSRTKRTAPTDR